MWWKKFTSWLLVHRCAKCLFTIELGDVLQILWSQAVMEGVPSWTLVVWPHHGVAGWGVSEAQCVTKLMKQHCEQISAFRVWEDRKREKCNADHMVQEWVVLTLVKTNIWVSVKPCNLLPKDVMFSRYNRMELLDKHVTAWPACATKAQAGIIKLKIVYPPYKMYVERKNWLILNYTEHLKGKQIKGGSRMIKKSLK